MIAMHTASVDHPSISRPRHSRPRRPREEVAGPTSDRSLFGLLVRCVSANWSSPQRDSRAVHYDADCRLVQWRAVDLDVRFQRRTTSDL